MGYLLPCNICHLSWYKAGMSLNNKTQIDWFTCVGFELTNYSARVNIDYQNNTYSVMIWITFQAILEWSWGASTADTHKNDGECS